MATVLALKPYIERIRTHCEKLSKAEVIDLLCLTAQEVSSEMRYNFLEKLSITTSSCSADMSPTMQDDKIISKIEEIIENIVERHQSIDDGSYYEEHYDDDYEECPDSISDEQQEQLEALFAEADQLFLAGDMDIAGKAYKKLTGLLLHNNIPELYYEIHRNDININWRETLSRYCRCVYETTSGKERIAQVLSAMEVDDSENYYDPVEEILPSLRDIFDVGTGDIHGWNDFLQRIKTALRRNDGNRAVLLYLEAVYWSDGLEELTAEVRRKEISVGYLYWLDQLETNASWDALAQAALESLDHMPFDKLRARAAAILSLAGTHIGDNALVVQGKREQFFSAPTEEYLALLFEEAVLQNIKQAELNNILNFIEEKLKETSSTQESLSFLKIKVMLMLGKLEQAYNEIDTEAAVGWSYNKQTTGAVYASILLVLSKGSAEAKTVLGLFSRYLGSGYKGLIRHEILQILSEFTCTESQKDEWLRFVEKITTDRIDHIVSRKYRKAYARAAETMGGYMECLVFNDHKNKAVDFLNWNRNQKYNRFSAFRREVDQVIKTSSLLARL